MSVSGVASGEHTFAERALGPLESLGLDDTAPLILTKRISTKTRAGAALTVPAGDDFGELIEIRATSAKTGNYKGLFMQIDTSVASDQVTGMEVSARRTGAVAVTDILGALIAAYTGNAFNTGNITRLYGASIEAQVDDTYTGTITEIAALRAKLQSEDGATVTKSYGILVENEYVTGTKKVDAALAVKATNITTDSFDALINSTLARTTVHDTDQVTLFKFLNSAGTIVTCSYGISAAGFVFA